MENNVNTAGMGGNGARRFASLTDAVAHYKRLSKEPCWALSDEQKYGPWDEDAEAEVKARNEAAFDRMMKG